MYINTQSLIAHKNDMHHHIMKQVNSVIITLAETRLTKEIKDYEISV